MTKEEALKILRKDSLSNLVDYYSSEELQDAIDTIVSQPSLPSNLDEAAEKAYKEYDVKTAVKPKEHPVGFLFFDGFKAGAEWMAGQGCTVEIDEGYFINNPQHDIREGKFHKYYSSTFDHSKKIVLTTGDEVVVQIRKK